MVSGQEGNWFARAKQGFNALRQRGEERRAALLLRDHLRAVSNHQLHESCQAHLPDILSGEGTVGDQAGVEATAWVEYVLRQLSRVANLNGASQQRLLGDLDRDRPAPCFRDSDTSQTGPPSLPFGIFHAGQVWADGTWSSRAELGMDREERRGELGSDVEDQTGEDETSLFQADRRASREGRWQELMERFWGWFDEGRQVQLALAMLRQRAMDRTDTGYHRWVAGRLRTLGSGLEPNQRRAPRGPRWTSTGGPGRWRTCSSLRIEPTRASLRTR